MALLTAAAASSSGRPSATATTTASARLKVVDGEEPRDTGCSVDAITLDTADIIFPAGRFAGVVQLRYSPTCHAAWSRFHPEPSTGRGATDTVTVEVVRPADVIAIPFTITYGDGDVFSDMLSTEASCVVARATVTHGGQSSPPVETQCTRP